MASAGAWSPQQREWLQAMGYDVWTLAPDPDAMPAPHGPVPASAPPDRPAEARLPGRADSAGVADGPLLRALARAAGRPPQDEEFLRVLPDLASLRGQPQARRALWPRLRALRKRSRP